MRDPENGISVAVVGGGAAAVAVASAFLDEDRAPALASLTVIERSAKVGPGLAYGCAEPHHLLNSRAGKMGISERDPHEFSDWCVRRGLAIGPDDFAPRRSYGEYLAEAFSDLSDRHGGRLRTVRAEAVSVTPGKPSAIRSSDGRRFEVDVVVLAIGNPPPRELDHGSARIVQDPWRGDGIARLSGTERILLLGTGLTMVDVATSLTRRHPGVRLSATSRSLRLPCAHLGPEAPPAASCSLTEKELASGSPLGVIVRQFHRKLDAAVRAGIPWQQVVDGMRPSIGRLFAGLELEQQRRFLDHVARVWEVHRHRMAPYVARELERLRSSGRFALERVADWSDFDLVVNCTGPRPVTDTGWSRLVDDLAENGSIRADPLGLGVDVDSRARILDWAGEPQPGFYAIGTALRGAFWETTGVPEIRSWACAIADDALGEPGTARAGRRRSTIREKVTM